MISLPVFFVLISVLFVLAFIYPYVIYPVLLRYLPTKGQTSHVQSQDSEPLDIALLFCAYNEEATLPDKIDNLRMLKDEIPRLEIFAYSDCSTDATNQLLQDASDILVPVFGQERLGKVSGMQELVHRTNSDIVVFTDANVIVKPGSLTRLVEYFSDPGIGAVAATLVYDDDENEDETAMESTTTARVGGLYWRLEEHIKQLESQSGSMMGADGAFFARRRVGYPVIPPDLVDDMAVSLYVLFDNMRCVSAPDVIGMEYSVADRAEEFQRKRRIACGSYSTYRFLRGRIRQMPALDRFKFFSHKVMRWWGGFYLLAAAMAAIAAFIAAGVGLQGTLGMLIAAAIFIVLGSRDFPHVGPLYEILCAVVATAIGVVESIVGKRYTTWNPATTR